VHQNKANGSKNVPCGTNGGGHSNTVPKQLKPFVKGDPRINRKGRPKTFDQIRAIAQELAHEPVRQGETHLMAIERVLREWRDSPEPSLQMKFVEYAFGKVPDKIESIIDDKRTLHLHWPHERPDLATANGNGRS